MLRTPLMTAFVCLSVLVCALVTCSHSQRRAISSVVSASLIIEAAGGCMQEAFVVRPSEGWCYSKWIYPNCTESAVLIEKRVGEADWRKFDSVLKRLRTYAGRVDGLPHMSPIWHILVMGHSESYSILSSVHSAPPFVQEFVELCLRIKDQ